MAHRIQKQRLLRVNTVVMLTLVWSGLAVCALGALVYDVGRWVDVW
jgi:hypothetical protein